MVFSDEQIALFIQQYFFPFVRIGMLFMVMPVLGTRLVNARAKLALAFLVTLIVVPLLPPLPYRPALSLQTLLIVMQELAIGAGIGFVFQIVFHVFVLSGQFMAMKMGLGFASMNDPTNGVTTTILSQFYLMLVTLMFISVDGHLLLIQFITSSFTTLPPGEWHFSGEQFYAIVHLGSWMFAAALVMALPVLTSLLVVNMAFGVMSRAAPQLNIFAVGFPFTLVCGLLLIWIGLGSFMPIFNLVMDEGARFVNDLLLPK